MVNKLSACFIPVLPFNYVVFGATGDLAKRKLFPALFNRFCDKQFDDKSSIIGCARTSLSKSEFCKLVKDAIVEYSIIEDHIIQKNIDGFLKLLIYKRLDLEKNEDWKDLPKIIKKDNICAYYLALAPELVNNVIQNLSFLGLNKNNSRLVVEKPLGNSLESAKSINSELIKHFKEDQIFRIDHYLGKETVQNLLALRFANTLFTPIWNNLFIDSVQVTVAETVGVENRGNYYDKTGALKDMVQNHLLQLLCLVAMEPPNKLDATAVRDEKVKVLRALEPIVGDNVEKYVVRAQYSSGVIDQQIVPSYKDEIRNTESNTETYVAIKAQINNIRWAGVPFYLRTGKRLAQKVSEVTVNFKQIPHSIFSNKKDTITNNQLVLRLQPHEGVKLFLTVKDPGPGGLRLTQKYLDLSFIKAFDQQQTDAYERLLLDVIRGNQTLFMRNDEVEAAWAWIDSICNHFKTTNNQKINTYMAGSWGPTDTVRLLSSSQHSWQEEKDNNN